MNTEIKRRTRAVQTFPTAKSVIRFAGAVCCNQNDIWATKRNFIDKRMLAGKLSAQLTDEPSPEDVMSVTKLVEEAFDRKLRAA